MSTDMMTTPAEDFGVTREQALAIAAKGFDLLESGDAEGARVVFSGLVFLNPADATAHAALGTALYELGRYEEAEAAYELALTLRSDAHLARVNRGAIRCRRGDARGIDDLRQVAQVESPMKARAQLLLRRYAP